MDYTLLQSGWPRPRPLSELCLSICLGNFTFISVMVSLELSLVNLHSKVFFEVIVVAAVLFRHFATLFSCFVLLLFCRLVVVIFNLGAWNEEREKGRGLCNLAPDCVSSVSLSSSLLCALLWWCLGVSISEKRAFGLLKWNGMGIEKERGKMESERGKCGTKQFRRRTSSVNGHPQRRRQSSVFVYIFFSLRGFLFSDFFSGSLEVCKISLFFYFPI